MQILSINLKFKSKPLLTMSTVAEYWGILEVFDLKKKKLLERLNQSGFLVVSLEVCKLKKKKDERCFLAEKKVFSRIGKSRVGGLNIESFNIENISIEKINIKNFNIEKWNYEKYVY